MQPNRSVCIIPGDQFVLTGDLAHVGPDVILPKGLGLGEIVGNLDER